MTAAAPAGSRLQGTAARRRNEGAIRALLIGASLLSVLISAGIVLSLVFEAATFVTSIELPDLFAQGWFPRRGMFSIPTVLVGSLLVTVIAMALAAPVGLASAIYLSEYARPRTRKIIKPILEVLAGIPSVVLGFFALTLINPVIVRGLFEDAKAATILAAGLGVGLLTIPLVASVAEDAMRAVPQSLREASYGLGARRVTTSLRVVVPAAISGIVAALILAVSRAIGETMVVALAAGATGRLAVHGGSARPRPDADRRDGLPGGRLRPGDRRQLGLPEPVLPRLPAVPDHPRAQPHRRRLRPPDAAALLGAQTMSTAQAVAAGTVRQSLRGKRVDVVGYVFAGVLLFSLLFTLAVLAVLVGDQLQRGLPVLAERGPDFLTSPLSEPPRPGRRPPGHHRHGHAGRHRRPSSPSRSGS